MKVLKFGGTSLGSPERMQHVADLLEGEGKKIVVLSAVSGTTNALVDISEKLSENKKDEAKQAIEDLFLPYSEYVEKLYSSDEFRKKGNEVILNHRQFISSYLDKECDEKESKEILAEGELISTQLFQLYLESQGMNSALIPALEYMRIDESDEPMLDYIEENLQAKVGQLKDRDIYITQGYICLNHYGEVDNLKRGGSDYTASLVGAAIRADEVQIWTDIDGMHNNDPRVVRKTFPIAELSFDEAAELAYFGAKILHPSTILPAKKYNIPVRLLNTMKPEAKGTLITNNSSAKDYKAIAAKDGITAIKIKSGRMLLAYGFLRKVFEIFEKYRTPIDMITTSEVAVSVTIDNHKNLDRIVQELNEFGTVEVDRDQSIICIVGDFRAEKKGTGKTIFEAVQDIPVRMISYGGSKFNVSLLIKTDHKSDALNALNEHLFDID